MTDVTAWVVQSITITGWENCIEHCVLPELGTQEDPEVFRDLFHFNSNILATYHCQRQCFIDVSLHGNPHRDRLTLKWKQPLARCIIN